MRNYPKRWIANLTAIRYIKYQLETDDNLRQVSMLVFKADWPDRYHVIIEDLEIDTPDYYFMSLEQIEESFGTLPYLHPELPESEDND